jgi:hypothetical protein
MKSDFAVNIHLHTYRFFRHVLFCGPPPRNSVKKGGTSREPPPLKELMYGYCYQLHMHITYIFSIGTKFLGFLY